jgi:hypothetical protein
MTGPLAVAIAAGAFALAAWALVLVIRDARVGGALVIAAGVLEALLLVYLVVGIVQILTSDRDVEKATLVGYLVGLVIIPPLATMWSLEEKSRSAAGVLVVAFLVVPVMLARVGQVWGG